MDKCLLYRTAIENDYEELCKFPQNKEELFFMFPKAEYPLTFNQLKHNAQSRFNSTVIIQDGNIIGYANFYEVIKNKYCSIGNVIIKPNCRGKGIGEFLINTMERIAIKEYNISEIHLSCFNTNTIGILLYSKLGYKPYEIEKWTNVNNESFALIKFKKIL